MYKTYFNAANVGEVLDLLAQKREKARIIAGATDLILEMEKGLRTGIDTIIDISRISGLDRIVLDEVGNIHLGPLVTHNQCVESKLIREKAFPLARASWEVGSPQIRNRGTVVGNLVTASPANDTITPLIGLNASVVLQTKDTKRVVKLKDFYTGVRKTILKPDEMVTDVMFPAMKSTQKGIYIKHALRKAQAISLVNISIILDFDCETIKSATITLGAVAPTIIHAEEAEEFLLGKCLDDSTIEKAAELTSISANPISDVRSSLDYRKKIVEVLARRGLKMILNGTDDDFPENPIFLWGKNIPKNKLIRSTYLESNQTIEFLVNGKQYSVKPDIEKTLLRLLREDIGLTGTKEGCAEGECGACTVYLDGKAVMSCMVPAGRAHGAEITTIEGIAEGEKLHPVQQAFIEDGAVQCGYCTPGFVMSAVKLLEENKSPSKNQIQQAITGNLCRCTGYYKIIQAIEHAAQKV